MSRIFKRKKSSLWIAEERLLKREKLKRSKKKVDCCNLHVRIFKRCKKLLTRKPSNSSVKFISFRCYHKYCIADQRRHCFRHFWANSDHDLDTSSAGSLFLKRRTIETKWDTKSNSTHLGWLSCFLSHM